MDRKRSRFHHGVTDDAYEADELEFMNAVEKWKRENQRPFPTFSEILAVVKSLGYRKVERSE